MVRGLVDEVRAELARNYGPWINTSQYSTPLYTVSRRQPRVHVKLDRDLPDMQKAIDAVPIPAVRARPPGPTSTWSFGNRPRTPCGSSGE